MSFTNSDIAGTDGENEPTSLKEKVKTWAIAIIGSLAVMGVFAALFFASCNLQAASDNYYYNFVGQIETSDDYSIKSLYGNDVVISPVGDGLKSALRLKFGFWHPEIVEVARVKYSNGFFSDTGPTMKFQLDSIERLDAEWSLKQLDSYL
jgi:hypothetical protein